MQYNRKYIFDEKETFTQSFNGIPIMNFTRRNSQNSLSSVCLWSGIQGDGGP